tara:strand:- start:267 stop:431 length:165 start_codon:yes stop_codon:yes gene_type:complete
MKWRYHKPFVNWLLKMQYAELQDDNVKPFVSPGLVLYMYEAYQAGMKQGKQENG